MKASAETFDKGLNNYASIMDNRPSEEIAVKGLTPAESISPEILRKYPLSDFDRVPVGGKVPILDANGNPEARTLDGTYVPLGTPGSEPAYNPTYAYIVKNAKSFIFKLDDNQQPLKDENGDKVLADWIQKGRALGIPGLTNTKQLQHATDDAQLPARLAIEKMHTVSAVDLLNGELKTFAKVVGEDPNDPKFDLYRIAKNNKPLQDAIWKFSQHASEATQLDQQIDLMRKHPDTAAFADRIAQLVGPELLQKYAEARTIRQASLTKQGQKQGELVAEAGPLGQAAAAQKTAAKVAEERALIPVKAATAGAEAAAKTKAEQAAVAGDPALIDAIGLGRMPLAQVQRLLTKKPELAGQVALKYPDFDGSKVQSYAATYKDFTAGKTSIVLNAGGTALLHLQELNNLNTPESRVPGTEAHSRYQNKVQTVSSELARFYAGGNQPGEKEIAAVKDSLNGFRRASAIQTQIGSMGDKLDQYEQTWRNAAPSSAYQAKMPGISEEAKNARAALDPEYAKRRAGQQPQNAPEPGFVRFQDSQGGIHEIPQANLKAAQQRDPGLRVIGQ